MKRLALLATCAAAALFPTTAVRAAVGGNAELTYLLSGPIPMEFKLLTIPSLSSFSPGNSFLTAKLTGIDGTSTGDAFFAFFSNREGGGLQLLDAVTGKSVFSLGGAQLYSGNEWTPSLLSGTFGMTDRSGGASYTLKVAALPSGSTPAVPEPASWAMMIGGLGLVGGLVRTRVRRVEAAVSFS